MATQRFDGRSRAPTKQYEDSWKRIFGKKDNIAEDLKCSADPATKEFTVEVKIKISTLDHDAFCKRTDSIQDALSTMPEIVDVHIGAGKEL